MRSAEPKNGYQAPAVTKAFRLLDLVAASDEGIGISDIARQLGYSKGTIHGLTQALAAEEAIFQSPVNKKFFLGSAMIDRYAKSRCYIRIKESAQPWLDRLRDNIGESVFLGVLSPTRGIIVATAEPSRPLNISSPAGNTIPVLAGAVGKVFLAALDPEQAADVVKKQGLKRYTDQSVLDTERYLAALDGVRSRGYALDREEYLPGVNAVAMALNNQKGLMLALWIVGFAAALGPQSLPGIVQAMQETTVSLNRVLSA